MDANLRNEITDCQICLNSFDQNIHKPYSIYQCGHTYCVVCLEQINRTVNNNRCPECRGNIQNIAPNWQLLRIVSYINNHQAEEQPLLIAANANNDDEQINCLSSKFIQLYNKISNLSSRDKLVLFYVVFIALPVLSIYPFSLAIVGINDNICPIDYRIPIWVIVYGIIGIVLTLVYVIRSVYCVFKSEHVRSQTFMRLINTFIFLLILFLFVWFFVGTAWVFNVYSRVNYVNNYSNNYCQPDMFKFAFGTLIVQWFFFGFCILFFTCKLIKN